MDFSAEGILARMKESLRNDDTKIEGSFTMDNLQAVSEELARINTMRIVPLMSLLTDREDDMGTSGNERHYVQWAKAARDSEDKQIVGNAKVEAPRDGSGLVYIAILTVDAQPPSEEQIGYVQNYINNMRPVGAEPIVIAAEGIQIRITCSVKKMPGYTDDTVRSQIKNYVSSYFTEIAFQSGLISLNYHRIGYIISTTSAVKELDILKINGGQDSIAAEYDKYFVLEEMIIDVTE
jgi:uncharacterized phage protein gp47/JayE